MMPEHRTSVAELLNWLNTKIIGQERFVQRLLMSLLTGGHLLVEGAPGLAKTRAVKVLAECLEGDFHRIQFTPDLLPSDITGTEVFHPETGSFAFQKGPIFHNLLLADEINRAPAKVQSALLEAMAERQVSVGQQTYALPELFLVMATQNPIEQEGVYSLPEAQLDRFLMQVVLTYPSAEAERKILTMARTEDRANTQTQQPLTLAQPEIFQMRHQILDLHMANTVEEYIVQLIVATRQPESYGEDMRGWLEFGASSRGSIALDRCARARAWIKGRDFVIPEDVQDVFHDALRHRIILGLEAETEGHTPDKVLSEILSRVPCA